MSDDWKLNKDKAIEIFQNPDSYATTLHTILLKTYGSDALYGNPDEDVEPMDSLELFSYIEEDFGINISEELENKINAIMLATSTTAFYENPLAFSSICLAIATGDMGDIANGYFDDPTVPELIQGVMEVQLNHSEDTQFSPAVEEYIQNILDDESIDDLEDPELDRLENRVKIELFEELRGVGVPESFISYAENLLG
jgi:hypothetical protein